MKKFMAYFVSARFFNTSLVPFHLYCLAEKNDLALSVHRRLCGIQSKNVAYFETESLARKFIHTVKPRPGFDYGVSEAVTSYPINILSALP